jgi:[acyl-carrier-protein] S-malonyltransferase
MSKIAVIFPGQGSQYAGMGKEIARQYSEADEVFNKANEALKFDIKTLCFEGPDEELAKTENTQPAILTTSIALYAVLKKYGISPAMSAGLSLGEYSSLVVSGAMAFEDAVQLVKKRGRYMQEAVPLGVGTMAAIMGLDKTQIEEVTKEASEIGTVEAANFNCPGQIVIAGSVEAVEKACQIAKDKGAKRAIVLPVSAPFHSSMLRPAGEKLEDELKNIRMSETLFPVVSNVTAQEYVNIDEIKEYLVKQVYKSVLWQQSVEYMINNGIKIFVEVGPGKSLSAFVKKISKDVVVLNVEDLDSLNKTLSYLKEMEG